MRKIPPSGFLVAAGVLISITLVPVAGAANHPGLRSPAKAVVCDTYFCADDGGVSDVLTTKYLGKKKGEQLAAQGDFDRTGGADDFLDTQEINNVYRSRTAPRN